jgi:prolyl-tRNA synthetase
MTTGDNSGLVLPPRIAPTQVMVIPVAQHKPASLRRRNRSGIGLPRRAYG